MICLLHQSYVLANALSTLRVIVSTLVGAVLLVYGTCPALPDHGACVYYQETPPRVYVAPGFPPSGRRVLFQHELGHLACRCADEAYANLWAACHSSRRDLRRAWWQGVRVGRCLPT